MFRLFSFSTFVTTLAYHFTMNFPRSKTTFVQSQKTLECIYATIYRHIALVHWFAMVSEHTRRYITIHLNCKIDKDKVNLNGTWQILSDWKSFSVEKVVNILDIMLLQSYYPSLNSFLTFLHCSLNKSSCSPADLKREESIWWRNKLTLRQVNNASISLLYPIKLLLLELM